MSRRRTVLPALALVLGVIVGVVAVRVLRDDQPPAVERRDGSEVVAERGPLRFEPVAAFEVTYRVVEGRGDDALEIDETVWVRRPFESRTERRTAPGQVTVDIARLGLYATDSSTAAPFAVEVPPAPTAAAVSVEALLEAAERGLAQRREVREVLGRRCEVFRTGTRLTSAEPLATVVAGDHVDSCVDGQGIVLEDVVTRDGLAVARRVATSVDVTPSFDESTFAAPDVEHPTVRDGGGSTIEIDPTQRRQGTWFELSSLPPGFTVAGRFNVVPPQPENFNDPAREGRRVAGSADVLVDAGGAAVIVEQGATLGGGDPFEGGPGGVALDVPPFGQSQLLVSGSRLEVRVPRTGGRYVRLVGTVPLDVLVGIAGSLVEVTG